MGSGVNCLHFLLPGKTNYSDFADNETCITWSEGSVGGNECAKHIDLRVQFVHEARVAGHLELCKLDSKVNAADILTKASTPPDVLSYLRRRVMGH